MPEINQQSSHPTRLNLHDWWKQFGIPAVGEESTPEDPYLKQFIKTLFRLPPSAAYGILFAMVFDENRERARKGLDFLRSHYKKTHPKLSLLFGRPPSGRRHLLSEKDCASIALAIELGFKKADILTAIGLPNDSSNASNFDLLNRSAKKGRSSAYFLRDQEKLRRLPVATRKRTVLNRLKRIKILRSSRSESTEPFGNPTSSPCSSQ